MSTNQGAKKTVVVEAKLPWVDTGVDLQAGEALTIHAPAILNLNSPLSGIDGSGLQAAQHKGHQLIPMVERQVLKQRTKMLEERTP